MTDTDAILKNTENFTACLSDAGMDCSILPITVLSDLKSGRFGDAVLKPWAKSILVVTGGRRLAEISFTYGGKTIRDFSDCPSPSSVDSEFIAGTLARFGFHGEENYRLPQKALAVKSGLCEYGRNNLAYSQKYGSFISLSTFETDIPAGDYVWREVKLSDKCENCLRCSESCPGKAIIPGKTLIDSEKCITRALQSTDRPPDGFPFYAVAHINGCMKCQSVCPMNRSVYENAGLRVSFDESETSLLLEGCPYDSLPESVIKKLELLDIGWCYYVMGRNLTLMFKAAEDIQ